MHVVDEVHEFMQTCQGRVPPSRTCTPPQSWFWRHCLCCAWQGRQLGAGPIPKACVRQSTITATSKCRMSPAAQEMSFKYRSLNRLRPAGVHHDIQEKLAQLPAHRRADLVGQHTLAGLCPF
jgi:hypothetical protein